MKSQGLQHQEICRLTGISNNTLCKYLRMYQSGGQSELTAIRFYTPTSELDQHGHRLEHFFREHPPASLNEAAEKIHELTGLKRSPSAVGRFFRSLGMRPRKVGAIPSKADPEEQEIFRINKLEPRIEEAKQGKRALFFVDAAHFVFGSFLGVLWSFTRLFVKAPAGRQRFNVLGALNAITHELVLITNDTYINAESVCELLRKIALMNIEVPITLVLDNARYQKCNLVAALALELNIDLLFGLDHNSAQDRALRLVTGLVEVGRISELLYPWKCKLTEGSRRCPKILPRQTLAQMAGGRHPTVPGRCVARRREAPLAPGAGGTA